MSDAGVKVSKAETISAVIPLVMDPATGLSWTGNSRLLLEL